jgi:hypothetical protein
VSDKSALELELDINEIQELQTMCTQPLVRNILASIIVQFETVLNKTHCRQKSNTKEERKWLDIVAGGNPHSSKNGLVAIHNNETVITSRSPHSFKGNHEMETSKIIHPSTTRTDNKHQDKRPGIIILGDSHVHRYARELLQPVKQHFKVTGYVKPNAGLTELLNSAKEETSKLTKKDTVIVLGGTNDTERNLHGKKPNLNREVLKCYSIYKCHPNICSTEM